MFYIEYEQISVPGTESSGWSFLSSSAVTSPDCSAVPSLLFSDDFVGLRVGDEKFKDLTWEMFKSSSASVLSKQKLIDLQGCF